MFSLRIKTHPLFVMDDNGEISECTDFTLIYNGRMLHFIEQNGLYAYSNFFEDIFFEDGFPENFYDENGNLIDDRYNVGIFLTMFTGGWNENLPNLLQTINFIDMYIEEDEENILSFISRLKNGEGFRRVVYDEEEIMLKNYEGEEIQVDYFTELRRIQGYE
jgi:hypothetical protein